MLAKPNDSGIFPVVVSQSVGASKDRHAQRVRSRDSYDALYPVDQLTPIQSADDEAMSILWGDVSISARHPSRITA